MKLSEAEMDRYSRNILIKDIGVEGQLKLKNAKVLVIGVGGLGSPAVLYLAAVGIGTLGIVDPDEVSLSNLQRQIIHNTQDLGKKKRVSAQEKLAALNPEVQVLSLNKWVTANNITTIISEQDYDFILDCTDNLKAKLCINDACVRLGKPFSHASVVQFFGQLLTYLPDCQATCYRCFTHSADLPVLTGSKDGILGSVAGIIGSLQATEAIKYITGVGKLLVNQLLIVDAQQMEFTKVEVHSNPECPACGRKE